MEKSLFQGLNLLSLLVSHSFLELCAQQFQDLLECGFLSEQILESPKPPEKVIILLYNLHSQEDTLVLRSTLHWLFSEFPPYLLSSISILTAVELLYSIT